jgi:hypothetical protein
MLGRTKYLLVKSRGERQHRTESSSPISRVSSQAVIHAGRFSPRPVRSNTVVPPLSLVHHHPWHDCIAGHRDGSMPRGWED